MHNVIFTAPILNVNAIPTIRSVAGVTDTQVSVISQDPETSLPPDVRGMLMDFLQVENALSDEQLYVAATRIQEKTGKIDRMFAANEQVQVQVAIVREKLSIEGMTAETMRNFRDKSKMKAVLAKHDVPCAANQLAESTQQAWEFVHRTGYPVVAKPPAGAGAEFTYKIDDDAALHSILAKHPPGLANQLLLEEYITGEEFSFDTFSVNGKMVWHSLTKYLPPPLEVKRNSWIQWRVVLPREVDTSEYDGIRKAGTKALKVLGAQTGISHMEWFRRPDGRVAISEVGMRPPGAQITTLMSRAHEFDCMGAWATLMIKGTFSPPQRKYACGCAYLRGQGHGVVRQVSGFDQIQGELGAMITEYRLPEIGQGSSGSYEGEGFVIVRHPETKVVEDALLHIVSTMHVQMG